MWKCGRCGHTVSVSFVEALVDSIEEELDLIANVGDFDKYLVVREQPRNPKFRNLMVVDLLVSRSNPIKSK